MYGERVDVPQGAVDGEGVRRHFDVEALREHDLIDVARGDVLLRRAHARLELLAARVRRDARRCGGRRGRLRETAFELALEELNARAGELVERLEVLLGRDAGVGNEQDPVLDVIERQHRVEQHERRFRGRIAEALALPRPDAVERRLEPGRRVVAEEADGAPGEARQVGHEGRPVLGHHAPDRVDERLVERRASRPPAR